MEFLHQELSLSRKVIKGGFWVFALNISNRLLGLIRIIVLARILSPRDFGLMGIALLSMTVLETFSTTGFHAALIQKKDNIKSYLDTAWTVLVIRGVVLFAVLFLFAPWVAFFFKTSEATVIIQVIGLSMLFNAFTNIGVVYFNKELEFKKLFLYQFSGTIADFIVAISAILILRNVWALVFGMLAGSLVRCIVSYFIHTYKPRLNWDKDKVRELFGFGRWVLGSNILSFFIMQGDDIFVGKILGVTALGFYQMAYNISNIPATEITRVVSQVVFPVYSKMQDNINRLRESYLRVLQLTAFLSIPLAGILFILTPDLIKVILGEKWLPMIGAMKLLAVWGGMRAIGATSGAVFMAVGKPKLLTKIQSLNLILIFILIYPFSIRWSIEGTAMAIIFATLVPILLAFRAVCTLTKCKFINLSEKIIFPLISTLIINSCLTILKLVWFSKSSFLGIIVSVIFAVLLYLGSMFIFDKLFGCKMQEMLIDSWGELRKRKDVQ